MKVCLAWLRCCHGRAGSGDEVEEFPGKLRGQGAGYIGSVQRAGPDFVRPKR